MRKARIVRSQEYFKKLNEIYNLNLDFNEFCADNKINMENFTSESSIGRPLIAKYLMKKGLVTTNSEAFKTYLNDDSPAY